MLKRSKFILAICLLLVCVLGVTSCNIPEVPGTGTNTPGDDTPIVKIPDDTNPTIAAVYTQAVSLGYEGTLEEFLELVKGADGADGSDGRGIDTVVINEKGELYITFTDGTTRCAGVVKGEDGKDGVDGVNGTDGKPGADGKTPFVGVNGNWWIGDVDTGVKATGKDGINGTDGKDGIDGVDGTDGKDGLGISDIVIDAAGDLIITMTDGTVKNVGKVTNNTCVGFSELRITERKTLTVTLSNGIVVESAPFDVTFGGYINGLSINEIGEMYIYTTIDETVCVGTISKVYINEESEIIVCFTNGDEMSFGTISGFGGTACAHEYGEWTSDLLPDCTAVGYNKSTCALCGDVKFEIVPQLGHDYGDTYVIKEANGYENGVQLTACKVCGTAKMEFIDGFSKGLSYERTDKDEYRVTGMGTCTDTDVIVPDVYEGLPVTEIGEKAFYQNKSLVSIKLPESIVKIFDKAFSECENLETVSMPDTAEVGTDVFRGSINVEIIIKHKPVFVEYKEATCTEPGNIAYWWCTTCNLYYEDEDQTIPLYDVVIPNAHDFVDGVCTKCGKVQDNILIVSIQEVGDLGKFALGTLENAIGLPDKVNVVTADGVTHAISVLWNTSTYDKATAGEYTVYGILQSGEFRYADGLTNTISATLEITDFMKGTADIVFLLDISGSMSDEVNNVKNNIQRFAQALYDMGISVRFSAITYSDYMEYPTTPSEQTQVIMNGATGWYTDVNAYKNAIGSISLAGGGDWEEVSLDALMHAYYNSDKGEALETRKDARVFYILLTDADFKNNNHFGVSNMTAGAEILAEESINVSVITSSDLYDEYNTLVSMTGGITADIYNNFAQALIDALVPIIYGEVIA